MNFEQLWMELEKIDQCQPCVVTETPSWRRQCPEPTGVRIPEGGGQARPDQTETFYFHHVSPKLFLVLVRKNWKFLGGPCCYLHSTIYDAAYIWCNWWQIAASSAQNVCFIKPSESFVEVHLGTALDILVALHLNLELPQTKLQWPVSKKASRPSYGVWLQPGPS